MKGAMRLGSGMQEDLANVSLDLRVRPVGMEHAFLRGAQTAGHPVQPIGLAQPLGRPHRAIPRHLLGRGPIHDSL